jgi:predicted signal transduction protein with EAL and GGDEF domain
MVTVSVGVAVGGRVGDTVETLIKRSDEALYEAKRSGRNRVVADKRDIPLSVLQSLQEQQQAIPRAPDGAVAGSS